MNLRDHVAGFLARHQLERTVGIVAVSGGPDSVALAHLLVNCWRAGIVDRVMLAHIHHQLRGLESDEDEAFVHRLPTLWQEPRLIVHSTRIAVAEQAEAERENLEAVARRERYRWLGELARAQGATWIATGHTADDQAETVLFRLLRGAGTLGLAGIPATRALDGATIIRPLLDVRRSALLNYLKAEDIPYRVDSSNQNQKLTRNRIRHELLPLLERDYNPAVVPILCQLAEQAREEHAQTRAAAERLLLAAERPRAGDMLVLAVAPLQDAEPNLVREMFRLLWQREGWPLADMDRPRWHWLVEIAQGSRPACDLPGPVHARRAGPVVQLRSGVRGLGSGVRSQESEG